MVYFLPFHKTYKFCFLYKIKVLQIGETLEIQDTEEHGMILLDMHMKKCCPKIPRMLHTLI